MSNPCGGCGAKSNSERCIGCFHDFETPESSWVKDIFKEKQVNASIPTDPVGSQGTGAQDTGGIDLQKLGKDRPVFLVWTGLRGKPETHQLRAVDDSREVAERHLSMCEHENEMRDAPAKSWIEQSVANHLYGYDMWAAVDHATRLRQSEPNGEASQLPANKESTSQNNAKGGSL